MFKSILKSLSDTELVSVALEITNHNIKVEKIAAQLSSKSNHPIFIVEKTSDEIRSTLNSEIISELSSRILRNE